MASLTESVLIYPDNNGDSNKKQDKTPWYNNVYLCIEKKEKKENRQYINGFNCYTFANFNQADIFYKKHFTPENANLHTMIPVCKWIPCSFHKYYLNYALKKLYWKNEITIFKNKKYI